MTITIMSSATPPDENRHHPACRWPPSSSPPSVSLNTPDRCRSPRRSPRPSVHARTRWRLPFDRSEAW